jgi:alkylhydroperoxidase/carboxymuconolactone decarboxylase family protein YurZ
MVDEPATGDEHRTDVLYQRGLDVIRALAPPSGRTPPSDAALNESTMLHRLYDVATTTVMGAVWAREGLDLKTRALVSIAADAAAGNHAELANHLPIAVHLGWTEDEIFEVLLQVMAYYGAAVARDAAVIADRFFRGGAT